MQWLELHNVEYGECIVFGRLPSRYSDGGLRKHQPEDPRRGFGFQRLCGPNVDGALFRLLRARVFVDPLSQGTISVGCIRCCRNAAGILTASFCRYPPAGRARAAFVAGFCFICLCILAAAERLCAGQFERPANYLAVSRKVRGRTAVYPIAGGSSFLFDGVTYEVLWPDRRGVPLFGALRFGGGTVKTSAWLPRFCRRRPAAFWSSRRATGRRIDACCQSSPLRAEGIAQLDALLEQIDALLPELHLLPTAPDVCTDFDRSGHDGSLFR